MSDQTRTFTFLEHLPWHRRLWLRLGGRPRTAPVDPGTYEWIHGKPRDYTDPHRHNKWCARECERSALLRSTDVLEDFTKLVFNMPERHPEGDQGVKHA